MTTLFFVIFFGIAALIGLWALACLVSALLKRGPLGLIKDYFAALTGKDKPSDRSDKKNK